MPLWDGEKWHMWLPSIDGKLIEGAVVDTVEGDYLAIAPARNFDLFVPFFDFLWQRASWPEVCPFISAISNNFHNMGTSLAKLKHLFDHRKNLPDGAGGRFARTEVDYVIILSRSVFDLLQEMISSLWMKHVRLNKPAAEKRRRSRKLPETFSRIVLRNKEDLKSAGEISEEYGLPPVLAKAYATAAPFFSQVRGHRNDILHGLADAGQIFVTEKGFCVNPKEQPFCSYNEWRPEHNYNTNLVSLLPWLAETVHGTIGACTSVLNAFAATIQFPPEIAPGYRVFIRGPYGECLASVLRVRSGASPWWG